MNSNLRIKTEDHPPETSPRDTASDVWLIDVSGSMVGRRRGLLVQGLAYYHDIFQRSGTHARFLAFNTILREIPDPGRLPSSDGGTYLHLALERAADLCAAQVIVFTDGEPYDAEACFQAARRIPGVISCVFCGDTEDSEGLVFCRKLGKLGGGFTIARDLARGQSLICGEVRDLLGLPAPRAM
jgi:hypothetical protein